MEISIKKRPFRRQELNNNYYFINGALYCFKIGFFKRYKKVFNTKTYAYEIPKINFVDINEEFDFKLAKIIQKILIVFKNVLIVGLGNVGKRHLSLLLIIKK